MLLAFRHLAWLRPAQNLHLHLSIGRRAAHSHTNAAGPAKQLRNEEIRAREVLYIDEDGVRHDGVSPRELLGRIDRRRFDLVLVNATHVPPVAKLVPRSLAFQRARAEEHAATLQRLRCREKEVRFGTEMAQHDLRLRLDKVLELLDKAYRVRVVIGVGSRATVQAKEAVQRRVTDALRDKLGKDLVIVAPPEAHLGRLSVLFASATAQPPLARKRTDPDEDGEKESH